MAFKVIVFIAAVIACANAQPQPLESGANAESLHALPNSEMTQPLKAIPTGESPVLEEKALDGKRDKKAIIYDAFPYAYPAYPLVSSYSYQYHRAYPSYPSYPYAYSAAYYPYVYGPTYVI